MCQAILAKYRYRRRLPHLQRADGDFFITFCRARVVLTPAGRDLVLDTVWARAESRSRLYTVVIMTDDVHLLLSPRRNRDGRPYPLVDILQCLKSVTAHRINKMSRLSGPVWREESFDHVLRSDGSLKEKFEYSRQNPVRKGPVMRPEEYQWLAQSGPLPVQCAGEPYFLR
jgi:putative transposase